MDTEQILTQINDIFKDVLESDDIILTTATTAVDVEEWDSLNHIQLIVAIEKKFGIRFTTAEIYTWKNIGDMCAVIVQKTQK
ncbi:acyl carrier protein [Mucilaginibacter glaciei]|uniref:Acyl carrier protein n=1 Tax=Mucilaginibacter glaciei TaxID=2772109 RepID=A0A926S398_9SPHI|nr:acyl carrier protein [Mucilaginibacter glaciei]MBD1394707.1 acyl carrier protein [Mucilaginibacter glaciei]